VATDYKSEVSHPEGTAVYNLSATPSQKERGITTSRRHAWLYEDENFTVMEIKFSFT
jgi:hypothetical protein